MRKILLLTIGIVSFLGGIAQPTEFSLDTPDLKFLGSLTFEAVNELRIGKKIVPLVWDDALYRAAKDHADYLIKQKKLTHSQTLTDKSTPYKRVKIHGGISFIRVGENLVSVSLGVVMNVKGRKLSTQSYLSAAASMAQLWRGSPGHYKNIVNKDFNTTAVATSYDPTTQRVVAVQVFGFTPEIMSSTDQQDYADTLLAMPERTLPFGLKDVEFFDIKDARAIRNFRRLTSFNGTLMGSYKAGKRAFKGRRSGIVVESIPLSQFDSGASAYDHVRNRRTGLFALNGDLSRPVYRHALLKFSRQNSPRRLLVNLRILKIYKRKKAFLFPTGGGAGTNIFLIRKKKLVTYVTPMALPAELLNEPMPTLKFRNSFSVSPASEKFRTETSYDTLKVKVFYPSAVVTMDTLSMRNVRQSVARMRGKIVRIEASAYASIDGDMAQNQNLAKQRVDQFMAVVKPYLDTIRVEPTLTSKEPWDLFINQIKTNDLAHLQNLHRRQLREYINAHKTDSLILKMLAAQRFTLFKMLVRRDTLIPLPVETALDYYNQQKERFEALNSKTVAKAAALEQAQLKAYGEIIFNRTTDTLAIYHAERFPAFQYHDVLFRYLRGAITDDEFYQQLRHLGRSKYLSSELRKQLVFNNLVFIYKKYDESAQIWHMLDEEKLYCNDYRKTEFLLRIKKSQRCWRDESVFSENYYMLKEFPHLIALSRGFGAHPTDSLERYYTTSMIQLLFQPILPKEIFRHLAKIKSLYHPDENRLSVEERVRLAFFYCAFHKLEMAKSLLAPVADHPDLGAEGKKLFITLQADRFKEMHEYTDYIIKQYPKLGKREWCNIWTEGRYLTHLLLEDHKLKIFYNCNCQR